LVKIFLKVTQFSPYRQFFTNGNNVIITCQFVIFLNFKKNIFNF